MSKIGDSVEKAQNYKDKAINFNFIRLSALEIEFLRGKLKGNKYKLFGEKMTDDTFVICRGVTMLCPYEHELSDVEILEVELEVKKYYGKDKVRSSY